MLDSPDNSRRPAPALPSGANDGEPGGLMFMTEAWIFQLSRIKRQLESGWHDCLRLVEGFKQHVEDSIRERRGFSRLPDGEILKSLQRFCPDLYSVITDTLFRLIPIVQPDDCARHERLNFYFWPGYHSYLANKRIFINKDAWNFGVGVCGGVGEEIIEHYEDCSQARWYHYLVRKRNESEILPGNVHQWLRFQKPSLWLTGNAQESAKEPRGFVNSLTATTAPFDEVGRKLFKEEQELFEDNHVLFLDSCRRGTEEWGELYAWFVNQYRTDEDWTFPDRWGKPVESEARLRALRCKMHAVWLHAVFCDSKPEWLDGFISELLSDADAQPAGKALQQGLKDGVAADWQDATHARPHFSCWSYLSLHSSLAPLAFSDYDPPPSPDELLKRVVNSRTLGSAELLSSVTLRPIYFSIVRPWISEVYGLVRNAEISILLQNHKLEARKAELAGPYWAHELMKLTDEGLSTVLRNAADTSPAAVNSRRFVLHSIRMLGSLAYAFTGPAFSGERGTEVQRDEFLAPLRELYERGSLIEALRHVVQQTYENVCYGRGGRVAFSGDASAGWKPEQLSYKEQCSCFLLVSEMVRNYCESEEDDCIATWEAFVNDSLLTVKLVGTTRSQRNPSSMTLARLNVFLRALDIGKADVEWNKEQGMCAYTVEVNLSRRGAVTTGEKEQTAPGLADSSQKSRTVK
jgi:hypothetical protein